MYKVFNEVTSLASKINTVIKIIFIPFLGSIIWYNYKLD